MQEHGDDGGKLYNIHTHKHRHGEAYQHTDALIIIRLYAELLSTGCITTFYCVAIMQGRGRTLSYLLIYVYDTVKNNQVDNKTGHSLLCVTGTDAFSKMENCKFNERNEVSEECMPQTGCWMILHNVLFLNALMLGLFTWCIYQYKKYLSCCRIVHLKTVCMYVCLSGSMSPSSEYNMYSCTSVFPSLFSLPFSIVFVRLDILKRCKFFTVLCFSYFQHEPTLRT